jgi:hypothetical protein
MPDKITQYNTDFFKEMIAIAENIIRSLQKEDEKVRLNALTMLQDIPQMPRDSQTRQLKIYKETNTVLKKLYIASAKTIIQIIESNYTGFHDKAESYNYASPKEPIAAAEAIKLLPNAFIGGPIKSAVNSTDPNVRMIAINYYESLPSDIRISEIFPKNFSLIIKKLKVKLEESLMTRRG